MRISPRVSVLLVLVATLAFGAKAEGAQAGTVGAEVAPPGACPGDGPATLRCLVNWTRRRHGLAPLRDSARLDRSSRLRATSIRRCEQFSHTACGEAFATVFQRVGYLRGGAAVGENLAWGAPGPARLALVQWLRSPSHRANLLSPGWRDVGVGLVRAGRLFGANGVSVWVVQFGRR
jgi:uncharacterized protein YkwD